MKWTKKLHNLVRPRRTMRWNPWLHGWPTGVEYRVVDYPMHMLGLKYVQHGTTWEIVEWEPKLGTGIDPDNGTITAREVK